MKPFDVSDEGATVSFVKATHPPKICEESQSAESRELWCCGCRPAASSKRRKYAKMDCSHMGILKGNEGGKEEGKDMEKKKK
jgi:hypothetical protein